MTDFDKKFREFENESKIINNEMKKFVQDGDKALLLKIDEIHTKCEQMEEKMKGFNDGGSSQMVTGRMARAEIVAAPVQVAPTMTQASENRSQSPTEKKRSGASKEQLEAIYSSIN